MLLRRVAVADPFALVRNEIDRTFGASFSTLPRASSHGVRAFPALNVREDETSLQVEAELPGRSLEDVEVSVFGDELTIKSAKAGASEADAKDQSYLRRERFCGRFERTISLPVTIDADRVEALLKDGVLKVTLPKAVAAMPRKISVKTCGV